MNRELGRRATAFFTAGLMVVMLGMALLPRASAVTCPSSGAMAASASHPPILIQSDRDFTTANGVISGTGTSTNPYAIGNLKLDDLSPGYGLKVDNSRGGVTKYFNLQCIQSSFTTLPTKGVANLIWLVGVHSATTVFNVSGNSAEGLATGVRLDGSSQITLDSLSLNKVGGNAVDIRTSDHITILHSKLKASGSAAPDGFYALNSHDLTIGDPCDLSQLSNTCNEFTYDDGRGIHLVNSFSVVVRYTKTNADDTGGIVLEGSGTYGVTLTNGIASGNGPICPQSGGTPTGLKVDYIAGIAVINGAHDINVKGYTINGNTHHDIENGGDGLYPNPCTGLNESLKKTPAGGANLDFNGNCYHNEFGFNPVPTDTC